MGGEEPMDPGLRAVAAHRARAQSVLAHQARDTPTADIAALLLQRVVDARTAGATMVPPLERLQLRDRARGSRRRRFRQPPAQRPVAHVLPPLGEHERMDAERSVATACTCRPETWLRRTAASWNSLEYW